MATGTVRINVDGASRGNPGPASIGGILYAPDGPIEFARAIGTATNNIAEYTALVYALQEAVIHQLKAVSVYTDSLLMAQQIKGNYKVKNPQLRVFFDLAQHLISSFSSFSIHHIPREENKDADSLANYALDQSRSGGRSQMLF